MYTWMEFMSFIKYNQEKNQWAHKKDSRKEIKQAFVVIAMIGLSFYKL
jgi:hypothetical protein